MKGCFKVGIMLEYRVLIIIVLPVWILIRAVTIHKNRSKGQFSIKREVVLNLFFIYILCFIAITLLPLMIKWNGERGMVSINLVPVFNTITDITRVTVPAEMHNYMIKFWIKNIFGNMLLLFPFGLLLPLLWKKFQNAGNTLLISFLFSFSIESIQLLSSYIGNRRSFDIDDILLNTFGALVGYIFYRKIVLKLINKQLLNDIRRDVNYSK